MWNKSCDVGVSHCGTSHVIWMSQCGTSCVLQGGLTHHVDVMCYGRMSNILCGACCVTVCGFHAAEHAMCCVLWFLVYCAPCILAECCVLCSSFLLWDALQCALPDVCCTFSLPVVRSD